MPRWLGGASSATSRLSVERLQDISETRNGRITCRMKSSARTATTAPSGNTVTGAMAPDLEDHGADGTFAVLGIHQPRQLGQNPPVIVISLRGAAVNRNDVVPKSSASAETVSILQEDSGC